MPHYIRARIPGGTFFFTVVTFQRRSILATKENIRTLTRAIYQVQSQYPFTLDALVALPDHLHALWTLPEGDGDYGKRWGLIKAMFSKGIKGDSFQKDINPSRLKRRETTVWQRRFWEHAIRDDEDFQKHFDYIHYNPMKHGLVGNVIDWPYSTFHRYVKQGFYSDDWGAGISFKPEEKFGE